MTVTISDGIFRIRSKAEYESVLKRIEVLMDEDPAANSAHGFELKYLAIAAEKYEELGTPDFAPPPSWEVVSVAEEVVKHVIPVNDSTPHMKSSACLCHPAVRSNHDTGLTIVHKAWDGRPSPSEFSP